MKRRDMGYTIMNYLPSTRKPTRYNIAPLPQEKRRIKVKLVIATSHMTCNRNFFESLERRKSTVYLADNTAIQAEGIGHGWLFCVTPDGTIEEIHVKDVLFIPSLETGLLSA
ncbi:MAP kinase-activating death domain protein [Trichinella spiralis]|uniref:MAP kinase-activating death domain protein n=1 Tax=Trichinella spiralis TaxID=6334 RepID=UPI0001EFBD6D|nr:MAP kinase-activating death domain protein [Trichinella spiralis]